MALNEAAPSRATLRQQLLAARRSWHTTEAAQAAQAALTARVRAILMQLEPTCLGVYWPMQGEFNPREAALAAQQAWGCQLALPFATRQPVAMRFRAWDGGEPDCQDECRIPSTSGREVTPDVVLVPCVGFTAEGWRLGYGGGYFDRYMADHPAVTAIGVAWEAARLTSDQIAPQAHDIALMAVLTERNTWSA
jgi:5,10-methenyltetrahydrofolate synthetase